MEKGLKLTIFSLLLIITLLLAGCNESSTDKVLSESDKLEIKKLFSGMDGKVELLLFTSQLGCYSCSKTETLMREIDGLSDKISLKIYDKEKNEQIAAKYNIELVPAVVIVGKENYGIKQYGFPGGREIMPFLEAIKNSSMQKPILSEEISKKIDTMDSPVEVKIFITSTCPYCPDMVRGANYYALAADKVSTVTIMSNEFDEYSKNYKVNSVPTIIFNEKVKREGQMSEEAFVNYLVTSS